MKNFTRTSSIVVTTLLLTATQAHAETFDPFKWISDRILGPSIEIPVQHPPELQIHIDGVAIAQPEGPPCAQPLATRLEQAFLQAGVTVVDRQKLDKVLNEFKLQASGAVDERTAAKIGRMLGAQALIFTQVSRCNTANSREESYRDKKTGKVNYNYITQANMAGTVRVIALTTGRVLASQPFEATTQLKDGDGYPDAFAAMAEAEKSASESVKKTLIPWTEMVSMPFNDDKQCDLRAAHDLVKAGDFGKALEQSRTNAADCTAAGAKAETIAKAHHNVGVLQMYFGDYDAALASFTEADRVQSNKGTKKALNEGRKAQQLSQALAAFNSGAPAKTAAATSKGTAAPAPAANQAKATPASTFQAETSKHKPQEGPSIKERLVELNDLCQSGLLTQDECANRRNAILNKLDAR